MNIYDVLIAVAVAIVLFFAVKGTVAAAIAQIARVAIDKAKIKSAVAAALFKLFLSKNYKVYKAGICCGGTLKSV